ncbi:MAG: hypothetical protein ACLSWS_01060, partial [Faecalispora jeddahensis]
TGWERKMPGFDGVIAVVYTDVHDCSHPFLAIVENLEGLLVLSKLAGENLLFENKYCSFPAGKVLGGRV